MKNGSKAELLSAARAVVKGLQGVQVAGRLKVGIAGKVVDTDTDGWAVTIGKIRGRPVNLEIWLDRFSGHPDRKLYACFWTKEPRELNRLLRQIPCELTPAREVRTKDTDCLDGDNVLREPLRRTEFDVPVVERYPNKDSFFLGMFSPSRGEPRPARTSFSRHAIAFFETIAQALGPKLAERETEADVYPRAENRQRVVAHLRRERSSLLAKQRKILDDYRCRVCGIRFAAFYGRLGEGFAEAHHLDALSGLTGQVINDLDDLATVCANCHRMLHRMTGKRGDIAKLRAIVGRRRRK